MLLAVWIENTTFVQADGLNVEKLHPVAEIVVIIFYDTSASSVFFFFVLGLTFDSLDKCGTRGFSSPHMGQSFLL